MRSTSIKDRITHYEKGPAKHAAPFPFSNDVPARPLFEFQKWPRWTAGGNWFLHRNVVSLRSRFQILTQAWLPYGLRYWLPLWYIIYRVGKVTIGCRRIFTGTFTNVKLGRWSATLPGPDEASAVTATSDGVVMFLLGARINQSVSLLTPRTSWSRLTETILICHSPLGKLAPGNAEIDKVFKDMWVEAEKNRTKWSCESRYRTPLFCFLSFIALF